MTPLDRIMAALDRAQNSYGDPLGPDKRAAIFAAFDAPSVTTWKPARSVIVRPEATGGAVTLWGLVVNLDPMLRIAHSVPSSTQILAALELLPVPAHPVRINRDPITPPREDTP